jgi:hypothetical protein
MWLNVSAFPEQEEALSNAKMSTASTTTVLEYCRPMSTVNNNITLVAITSTREKLLCRRAAADQALRPGIKWEGLLDRKKQLKIGL